MVREIVVARKRCFLLEGKQRESLETRLNEFLKQTIQPLWPDGWMSMTALSKVCGNVPDAKKSPKPKTNTSSIDLPQNLSMNPSLSITPLPTPQQSVVCSTPNSDNLDAKLNSAIPDLQITKAVSSASNGIKQEPVMCDSKVEVLKPQPSKVEVLKPQSSKIEVLKPQPTKVEVLKPQPVFEPPPNIQAEIIPKIKLENLEQECQVIDLTGHADAKRKPKSRYYPEGEKLKVNSDGDDIQKVMEGLKVLQKMSSPIKTENTTSSPVSVIAFNKSYSPKSTVSQPSTSANSIRQNDYTKADFCSGFQDAFQKQLLGEVSFLKSSSSQPAPSFKATNLLPDDYMQVG